MSDAEMQTPEAEEARLAELVDEFQSRYNKGEAITIDSFCEEHPEMKDDLLAVLPAVVDIDSLGRVTRPPAPALATFPERLGDYRLLDKLGSGGMGTVLRAIQESLNREVAVKVLAPAWGADARHCEAFRNESRLIAGLRHTNIVEVYGAGQEGAYRYYVMALVHGHGLSATQLYHCFPDIPYEQAVAKVGLQAAQALAFAHSHGVLHRDVKPGNLLLDNEGVLHVSDFGLATALNEAEEAPLMTQSIDGTLRYMAPERLMKGVNSYAGDQYSLGLTLYELIKKAPVFRETEPGKLIHTICTDGAPPLRRVGDLGSIINKTISYDPADRYPSMADFADDLERYLSGKPVKARPASLGHRYRLWLHRRPAVAAWIHVAALLVLLLFASISWGYANVSRSLRNENEQRRLAEENARIADAALLRIFTGINRSGAESPGDEEEQDTPSAPADARLLQDLMPYYEEIAARAEQGDSKVARACRILADISLQVGEYATAETYYRRALEMETPYSAASMEAANGLATALFHQNRGEEAYKLLQEQVAALPEDASFEARLAGMRSLQLAAGYGAHRPFGARSRHGKQDEPLPPPPESFPTDAVPSLPPGAPMGGWRFHNQLLEIAAERLAKLLEERPDDAVARLRRVELLSSSAHSPQVQRLLAPQGENALSLLVGMMEEQPDNEEYQRVFLRLMVRGRNMAGNREELLQQAVRHAGKLLADHPTDSELLMLYLTLRDRYSSMLARRGQVEEAARENERTLGVLSYIASRSDFKPEMRERLIGIVSHKPSMGERESKHREEELRTLLRDFDEARLSTLREMIRQRQENFRRNHREMPPFRGARRQQRNTSQE